MSSSRSIASARQKRTGESAPVGQQGRPVTSISSAQMFAQQQQQQYQPQQKPQYQQQQQQQMQQQMQPAGGSKIAIGDAIALVTIRLGRVETIIQKMEAEGLISGVGNSNSLNDNGNPQNDAVILNIMNRLQDLEKNQNKFSSKLNSQSIDAANSNTNSNMDVDKMKQDISSISQEFTTKISDLQKELNEAKFLLAKLQSFTMETNQKLIDVMLPVSKQNVIKTDSFNIDDANNDVVQNSDSNNKNDNDNDNDAELVEEDITSGVSMQEEIQQLQEQVQEQVQVQEQEQ
jgi:hypothetical protein